MIFKDIDISLDFSKTVIMGVVNTTPDSFSDGGKFNEFKNAMAHSLSLIKQGAQIIDIGGESTRPNAPKVSLDEELDRVIPLITALRKEVNVPISIDTSKAQVMQAAVDAGANLINDVNALQGPGALESAVKTGVPVCLMHMQGEPQTMQHNPQYQDVVKDVIDFLQQRANACIEAGISQQQILIDPGFGFGKTLSHNIELLKNLNKLQSMGYPILAGLSRKSMIGHLLGLDVGDREYASIALALMAAQNGAAILRVHDVKGTVDAIRMVEAVTSHTSINE